MIRETIEAAQRSNDISPDVDATGESSYKTAVAAADKYRRLRAWASKDPDAALAAAMKLPEGEQRIQSLEAVCLGIGETKPVDAVALAISLHLDEPPRAAVESLVQQWAAVDAPSSLSWATNLPASNRRDQLLSRIAFVESQQNPSEAASIVADRISPGPAQNEAVIAVLHQWAGQNVAAAAEWVKAFPEGPLRERALNELDGIMQQRNALTHLKQSQ